MRPGEKWKMEVWSDYIDQGYIWLSSDKIGGQVVSKKKPKVYDGIFWRILPDDWMYADLKLGIYIKAGQEPIPVQNVVDGKVGEVEEMHPLNIGDKQAFYLQCQECGKVFSAHNANRVYCTSKCRRKAAKKRLQGYNIPSDVIRTCAFCGETFKAKNSNEKYCSIECRKEVQRNRSRKYMAAKREKKIKLSKKSCNHPPMW